MVGVSYSKGSSSASDVSGDSGILTDIAGSAFSGIMELSGGVCSSVNNSGWVDGGGAGFSAGSTFSGCLLMVVSVEGFSLRRKVTYNTTMTVIAISKAMSMNDTFRAIVFTASFNDESSSI